MKKFLTIVIIFSSLLFALNNEDNSTKKSDADIEREKRVERNIQKQIDKEKKFGKEQAFYHGKDYDLKESEIDEASVVSIPEIDDDMDFDMDDVYD